MPGLTRQHFYFVLLATSNTVINGQFSTESKGDNCIGGECIIISSCKPILGLVFQVKAGDTVAKKKLIQSQCGFEGSLPKVCCVTPEDSSVRTTTSTTTTSTTTTTTSITT